MTRYLKEKAGEITIERGRMKTPLAPCTPGEIRQMRGVVGKISWAARQGMPQGAGDASILASTLPTPKVKDLADANAALRRLTANDVPLRIISIPLEHLGLITFSDGSLGNAAGGSSQIGHILCACHKKIHKGEEADVSILCYKSHKNCRAGSSTLLNESTSLSETLADAEWVAS